MKMIDTAEHQRLLDAAAERDKLLAIINTPELIDFPKAVMLEAQHQELRWGTTDRESKDPKAWFWLLSHLASRALSHHTEAERLTTAELPTCAPDSQSHEQIGRIIAYHREKAVHHAITSAAALSHWHAGIVGKHTAMMPASAQAAADAEALT